MADLTRSTHRVDGSRIARHIKEPGIPASLQASTTSRMICMDWGWVLRRDLTFMNGFHFRAMTGSHDYFAPREGTLQSQRNEFVGPANDQMAFQTNKKAYGSLSNTGQSNIAARLFPCGRFHRELVLCMWFEASFVSGILWAVRIRSSACINLAYPPPAMHKSQDPFNGTGQNVIYLHVRLMLSSFGYPE